MVTRVYKYLPAKHARRFCGGAVKVGTLYDYRRTEEFGANIGDRDEGARVDWSHDKKPKHGSEMNSVERRALDLPPTMYLVGNYVQVRVQSPDLYVLCFSAAKDPEIAVQLSSDYSQIYDSCIEVFHLDGLLAQITLALQERARYVCFGRCLYGSRRRRHDEHEVHPAFLKDSKYEYQQEVRAIWKSSTDRPTPHVVNVENISRYCRLLPVNWMTKTTPADR